MSSTIKTDIDIPIGMHIFVKIRFNVYKVEPRMVHNLRRDGKPSKVYDIFKEEYNARDRVSNLNYSTTSMTMDGAFEAIAALQGG